MFSVALSFASPRLGVTQHSTLGARTFLPGREARSDRLDYSRPPAKAGGRAFEHSKVES